MSSGPLPQVVWFKRDLRLEDHAALHRAAMAGPVVALVIVEPDYWRGPDTSGRQWRFWRACMADLAEAIARRGGRLCLRVGDAVGELEALRAQIGPFALWAHEETGNAFTFARDRTVRRWARAQGVPFVELRQFGVIRGRGLNRDHWAAAWDAMMAQPLLPVPDIVWQSAPGRDALPGAGALGLVPDDAGAAEAAGRAAALSTLGSFLFERGEHYTKAMSSPLSAPDACSRLSWHLAYGSVSMREVWQATRQRYADLPDEARHWRQALRSFMARLHWHCHFIQKLESEPEAEFRPFARRYVGLRPPADPARLAAWAQGRTGYPFVDAVMRALQATGWTTFRMRAMLMSFAAYDLWLPWQEAGLVLARAFIDYEPGIHWPQCQMQAGETGINTVRIYSPIKQGMDQDPEGRFIRAWVPELSNVPGAWLHAMDKMDRAQREALCPDYPVPIVDHGAAARAAHQAIAALRSTREARAEADSVQRRHGSRKRTTARKKEAQSSARKAEREQIPQMQFDL
ncbi:cryptochrome/deoxyribodipyrimidine photo-lyase family protein [Novosphingobium sp. KACC 22771]|uniref:cryptochrome/deoxyribodipyrimidine photo-lyase family protein n=1 Tax=Novosphingobium sp. KACC 22771 TaxID=3025670 RepID=UPI002366B7E3|nr:cryptochrome/deoxyribodipyrimidine photo-lyase family protein [Novosphingobium sp. KACC 22771]WDF75109.1 deoxyribodipyrimidine photo-lyase/cryptochrome family protein [Novosphingobium sp. KACC 22771]